MSRTLVAKFANPDPKKHSVRFNEVADAEGYVHIGAVYLKKTSLGTDWRSVREVTIRIEILSRLAEESAK